MFLARQPNGIDSPVRRMFDSLAHDPFFSNFVTSSEVDENEVRLPLDISETDNETVVRASLPGFKKEDVQVSFHDNVLTIRAERRKDVTDEGENFIRRERSTRTMTRSVELANIDTQGDFKADLEDGVLTLRLPHTEAAKPRQIEIA